MRINEGLCVPSSVVSLFRKGGAGGASILSRFPLAEDRETHHHGEGNEGDEQRVHQHERGGSTMKWVLHDDYGMGTHKRRAVYLCV